jgi:hypothetical protein
VDAVIELPDGKRIETVEGSVTISEDSKGLDSSGHGTSSGTGGRVSMVLYHPPLQNGSVTRTIAFSNLISSPVTVTFRDGVPDKTNVVYKMRATP